MAGSSATACPTRPVFWPNAAACSTRRPRPWPPKWRRIIKREVTAAGASVEIKTNNLCRAVQIPADAWTVVTAQKALATVGIKAKTTFITGFTDASIYNNHGIEMAVVGIGARDEHSTTEHIHVADMEKAVAMLIEILRLSAA